MSDIHNSYGSLWKGLFSYTESDKDSFYGRNEASDALYTQVYYNKFVTLYGKSGIGKTSLLQAGLFPILREEEFTPLIIRFNEFAENNSDKPLAQYIIEKVCDECGIEASEVKDAGDVSALWSLFYGHSFKRESGEAIMPVVVLDQFEEVLINHASAASLLLCQLQALVDDNRIMPESFFPDNDFRMVIAIREDDLFRLEDCICNNHLSLLKESRYRLGNLSDKDAREIILTPGKEIFVEQEYDLIADSIIAKVKANDDNGELNTAILSLVCDQLFYKFYMPHGKRISWQNVDAFGNDELELFYLRATEHFTAEQRKQLEGAIVSSTGRRKIADYEELSRLFGNKSVDLLLDGRYRILYRSGKKNVELLHDLLAKAIYETRQKREAEEAKRLAEVEALRKRRRNHTMLLIQTCLLLLAALVIWSYYSVSPRILDGAVSHTTLGNKSSMRSLKVPSGQLYLKEDVVVEDNTFVKHHKIRTLRVGDNNTIGNAFVGCDSLHIILDGVNNSVVGLWPGCDIDTVTITSHYRPAYIASWRDIFTPHDDIYFDVVRNNRYVVKLNGNVILAKDETKKDWQLLHAPVRPDALPSMPLLLPDTIVIDETSLAQLEGRGYVLKPELEARIVEGKLYVGDTHVSFDDSLCMQIVHLTSEDSEINLRFSAFDNLKSVHFPHVTTIGEWAFGGCTSLESVYFPHAETIGSGAFRRCISLKSVDFPNVTKIGAHAFIGCTSLKSVQFPHATDIGAYAFRECTSLESVYFPHATDIGAYAFRECTSLKSVDFPNVTKIGANAFIGCTSLESVHFPHVTNIRANAFIGCTSLKSVDFPNVTTIGEWAFGGCTSLESVDFPHAKTIGRDAFRECTSLESVYFPHAMDIGAYAFIGCTSLKSVQFPHAKTIGRDAFRECTSLESVYFPHAKTIWWNAFRGCTSLESVDFPNVKTIESEAFLLDNNLKTISLSGSVKIEEDVFTGCNNLQSVTFGNKSLPVDTVMAHYAFANEKFVQRLDIMYNDIIPSYLLGYNYLEKLNTLLSNRYYSYKNVVYDRTDNSRIIWARQAKELFFFCFDGREVPQSDPAAIYAWSVAVENRELLYSDIKKESYYKNTTLYVPYGKGEECKDIASAFKAVEEMSLVETMYHYCIVMFLPYENILWCVIGLCILSMIVLGVEAWVKKRPMRKVGKYISLLFCVLFVYIELPVYYESGCHNLIIPRSIFYSMLLIPIAIMINSLLIGYIMRRRRASRQA